MYSSRDWFRIALQLRGSVVQEVLPRTGICSLFGLLIYVIHEQGLNLHFSAITSIVPNLVLGLLLVFRTNTAYERFWEGRKAWGSLVNTVRNLARTILVSVRVSSQQEQTAKVMALKLLPGFAIALKQHLRHQRPNQELADLLTVDQFAQLLELHNPPLTLALWLQVYLEQQAQEHNLEPLQLVVMVHMISQMVDALGVCERIQKTPIPIAYAIHLRQLLMLYCLALPFQIVDQLGFFTPVIVGLVSFTLLGIEEIGLQIEEPFGHDANDLPLDQICQTMVVNISDLILVNLAY